MLLGAVLVLAGAFGVVWSSFLVSRKLRDTYGITGGFALKRALKDDGMASLRTAMRLSAAAAVVGFVIIIINLVT